MDHYQGKIKIDLFDEPNHWIITYATINPNTGRYNEKRIVYNKNVYKNFKDKAEILSIANKVINSYNIQSLFGKNLHDPNVTIPARDVRRQILKHLNYRYKTVRGRKLAEREEINNSPYMDQNSEHQIYIEENPVIFNIELGEGGKSGAIMGKGSSGKTYFAVQQLNKLKGKKAVPVRGNTLNRVQKKRPLYDKIILITGSDEAGPLKNLDPALDVKIASGRNFKIPWILKRINLASGNHFRFLVLFDDIVTGLRKGVLKDVFLTIRNSNISPWILIQAETLLDKNSRETIFDHYVTGLPISGWEKYIKNFIYDDVKRALNFQGKDIYELASQWKSFVGDNIVHFNNLAPENKVSIILRKLNNKNLNTDKNKYKKLYTGNKNT